MGIVLAALAYLMWGLVPIYWKQLAEVPAVELIGHRVVWTGLCCLPFLLWGRRRADFVRGLRSRSLRRLHAGGAVLITINWLSFVWAVLHGRILDTSLGYFMCPLVSVLLATVIEGERLRPLQWAAVAAAGAGVGWMVWQVGSIPVIALLVSFSWAGYALIKRRSALGSVAGLGLEIAWIYPFALGGLGWLMRRGEGALDPTFVDLRGNLWLLSSGVVTVVPLVLFAEAAKRISMTTLGLFQYLMPTTTFGVAVFIYGEPFTTSQLITFAGIWCGLGFYLVDRVRTSRRARAAPVPV